VVLADQQNKKENPEKEPPKYTWFLIKVQKNSEEERYVLQQI
jgi:hypothetical protein